MVRTVGGIQDGTWLSYSTLHILLLLGIFVISLYFKPLLSCMGILGAVGQGLSGEAYRSFAGRGRDLGVDGREC